MEKNQKYHPVGLLLAEKGLFGLLLAEEGLFGQPLAKKDIAANRWPKSSCSSANTCSLVLENSYQLGFLVF